MLVSLNFAFLEVHNPQLVRLGALAERYFATDPNTCLIKLRQFGELLAQLAAAKVGLYESADERQIDLLRRLRDRNLLKGDVDRLFHELRMAGNEATHGLAGNQRQALSCLKYARYLAVWFHKAFTKNPNFDPGPFIPPPDPAVETLELKAELERLREEVRNQLSAAEAAQALADAEAQRRLVAEELAQERVCLASAKKTTLSLKACLSKGFKLQFYPLHNGLNGRNPCLFWFSAKLKRYLP